MNEQNNDQFNKNTMNYDPITGQPINNNFSQPMMNEQPMNNNFGQPMLNQPSNNNFGQPMMSQPSNNNKLLFIIGGVALAFIAVIVVLFCFVFNTKTLVCTNTESVYGVQMDMEAIVKFRGKKVVSATAFVTVDLGKNADYKDMYLESLEDSYSDYEEDGVKVEIDSDDTKIYVKISGENTNSNFIGSSSERYEQVKSDLELDGFVCK